MVMTGTPRSSAKRSVACLPHTKNGIFRSSCSASADQVDTVAPGASDTGAGVVSGSGCSIVGRCGRPHGGRAEVRGGGALVELEVLPEHVQQVLFEAHHRRVHPGVEHHVHPRSPSAASSAPGSPARAPGPRSPRRARPGAWQCGAPSACPAPARGRTGVVGRAACAAAVARLGALLLAHQASEAVEPDSLPCLPEAMRESMSESWLALLAWLPVLLIALPMCFTPLQMAPVDSPVAEAPMVCCRRTLRAAISSVAFWLKAEMP